MNEVTRISLILSMIQSNLNVCSLLSSLYQQITTITLQNTGSYLLAATMNTGT